MSRAGTAAPSEGVNVRKSDRRRRRERVLGFLVAVWAAAACVVLPALPAVADPELEYVLVVQNNASSDMYFNLRSDTHCGCPGGPNDRVGSGLVHDVAGKDKRTLKIGYHMGDHIYLDWEVNHHAPRNGKPITGATKCTSKGTSEQPWVDCNVPDGQPGLYRVGTENKTGAVVIFCIKTTTSTSPDNKINGSERQCTGQKMAAQTEILNIRYTPGDWVKLDFEVKLDPVKYPDNVITGGHNCVAEGILNFTKVDCHLPTDAAAAGTTFAPKSLAPYAINVNDPEDGVMQVLGLLAWCVTAACVLGLMIIGINMAVQLRRGEPGEFGTHWRAISLVTFSCILGVTAGPLVAALGFA